MMWVMVGAICVGSWGRAADFVFFPRASQWKFLPGLNEASPDTTSWRKADFDDASWEVVPGPIGYGDPPYGTDLAEREPPMRGTYSSIFLRREFDVPEIEDIVELTALVDYDDGFVIWINEIEVLRHNVAGEPGDALTREAIASRSHESGSYDAFVLADHGAFVVEGTNVIAVQAVNRSQSNSDFKFDLELIDPFGPDVVPPSIDTIIPAAGSTVRRLSQIELSFSENVVGVDRTDLLINGRPASAASRTGDRSYIFQFPEPPVGEVEFRWIDAHGIADLAEEPNAFGGGGWTYTLDPNAPPPAVEISEFLADNQRGYRDADGETSDWVELHNRGDHAVNLSGWSLSDDPSEAGWTLPGVTIGAGEYLVVFASGKNRRDPDSELHADFRLNADGEDIVLYTAELPREAVSKFSPYPEQRADLSYGVDADGVRGYFEIPTPGEPNPAGTPLAGIVEDVKFDTEAGFFDAPFPLTLVSPTPSATIYYTTDASVPGPENGIVYEGAFQVAPSGGKGAVTVRAAAYLDGLLPSRTATRSYVFPDDVLAQADRPAGFPTGWTGAPAADYGMDPEVIAEGENVDRVREGLLSLPTLSMVSDVDDMFGPARGIYTHATSSGVAWERPCSAELIYPDGREGFQIDCGVRILGGASRESNKSPKHSFRLLFKGDYGPSKLNFPLFADSRVSSFDTLVLRANFNNSWIHWDGGQRRRGMMIRDQWAKDIQVDMGQASGHAVYVNLYVNGLYWGVFVFVERPSAPFAASYGGGDKDEYDALNSASPVDGDTRAWTTFMTTVRTLNTSPTLTHYLAVREHLDTVNFIDYLLVNFHGANKDWAGHNWYAARRRVPGGRWSFYCWDTERIHEGVSDSQLGVSNANSPGEIYQALRKNPEFRLEFADRVRRHLFDDGALTAAAAAARFRKRVDEIDRAVVCESARWGDYRRDVHRWSGGPYEFYRYESHWLPERDRLLESYFPQRTSVLLRQLTQIGLYPGVEAPSFTVAGGAVEVGTSVSLTLPDGQEGSIYYTVDGTDPRVFGSGETSGSAQVSGSPILIGDLTRIRARTLMGDTWSALAEAVYRVSGSTDYASSLRITEILYNPGPAAGVEFIELHNVSTRWTLDLSRVAFTNGVDFRFEEGAAIAPGGYLVLVADPVGFATFYPGVDVYGTYDGSLDNGGEKLTLRDAANQTILSVDYDDDGLWPRGPDGLGFSLVLGDVDGDLDEPFTWRASATPGGSPGRADADVPPHDLVRITEVLAREGPEPNTFVEIRNLHDEAIDFAGWFISDSAESVDALRKFRIPQGLGGDGAVFSGPQLNEGGDGGGGFELTASTRAVYLAAADGAGNLTGYVFGLDLRPAEAGISFGLYETSSGLEVTPLAVPTPGRPEASPWISPVVVNEIHYHPLLDSGVEFVELYNRSSSLVSLYDEELEKGWRLRGVSGAVDGYEFPDETSIPPGGFLLVVGGDAEDFREQHGVPPGIDVLGPFSGALDNGGERISLTKPVDVGTDEPAEFRVDSVRFNDRAPWPVEADGGGPSLERIQASAYAGDPINWSASRGDSGTPGRTNSVSDVPLGGSQLPGDIDQSGRLNIADVIQLLGHLFRGRPSTLPCGDGTIDAPGNRALLDANGDGLTDVSDAVHEIRYIFLKGPPHVLGRACRAIPDCPALCQN